MKRSKVLHLVILSLLSAFLLPRTVYSADGEYVYRASTEIRSGLPDVGVGAQSGAFIFDQNINIPAGRNGLQPNLKMQYNSQDEDQSNIAGYGWSFSIPYIQRLSKKGVDKLYTENYFYSSLSGEIVPVNLIDNTNGQYGAKVETGDFLNYTFNNNKWVVTDKTGVIYTFGNDATARQDDASNGSHAYKWMLQEIRDTNDNFVKYEYFKDNGQIYPERVVYTGHGVEDGIFEVIFNREARNDTSVLYNAGFKIRTQYRISNITVKTNGGWVRKYDFSYIAGDNKKRSLLSAITESGNKDGNILTLPPTTFTYQQKEKGWKFDGYYAPDWGSYLGYNDMGQRIADVTGDGLLDLFSSNDVYSTGNLINKKVFINNGNGGYGYAESGGSPTPIYMAGGDNGVRLGDVNGDSMLDFVHGKMLDNEPQPTKVFIKKIGQNDWLMDENYQSPAIFINISSSNGILDNSVRLADINGDGLADILKYTPWIKEILINQGDGTWKSSDEYSIPQGYYMSSQINNPYETVIMDVNGDGLEDFIYSGFSTFSDSSFQAQPVANTCLNIDGGKHYDCSYSLDVAYTGGGIPNTYDGANSFMDVNGDGLVDFTRGNGQKSTDPLVVFINKGDGTGWAKDTEQTLPQSFLKDQAGGNLVDNGLRMIDVNGDGLSDFLRLGGESGNYVYLNKGKKADLLIRIDHDKGAITEVAYKTAQLFKKTDGSQANPKLPFMTHVADKITTDDGLGDKATTNYQYEGGKYYFNDYLDKRFAGFQIVAKTDALGNVTKQYFHQGDETDSVSGEYADHPVKINMMYREDVFDSGGQLQAQAINKWEQTDIGNNRNFVFNSETVKKSYDSTGAHKDIAESFQYNNSNGNLTKRTEWGEVSAQSNNAFIDVGADSRVHTYSYATNSASITGLLSKEVVTDSSNGKIRETISYYDNLPFGAASAGNKTKDANWVAGAKYANNSRTYNNFGLVAKSYDANNNLTTNVYDSYNLYPTGITNSLGQTVQYQYDYAVGKPNKTTDANGYIFETSFDPLGRIKQERMPDAVNPASLVVSTEYFYTDNTNPRVVQTKKYLDSANTVDSYAYINGLDKTIQERTEAEDGFSVKDFSYNKLGLVQSETLAYFSVGSAQTALATNNNLYTNYTYDALKRVKTITNAVGTTLNNYSNWKVSTTDAKGNTKDYYNDAFGRLIQVTEKITNPAPGNFNTYYQYDGNNNLKKIIDALGNIRNFSYDGLGRRLMAEDLHAQGDTTFGVWNYTYDNNGNLISQTDPKNQTVTYGYDALNRKITEDSATQAGIEVIYTYDKGCTNGIGRLCGVANSSVATSNNYNALGQIASETKNIDAVNYITQYSYDRAGNVTSMIYPDNGEVKNQYNSAGLLENISRKESADSVFASVVNDFDYSPLGQIAYQEDGNGAITTNTYDETQLYRLTHKVTTGYEQKSSGATTTTITQTFYPTAGDGYIYKNSLSWDAAHDAISGSYGSYTAGFVPVGPAKSAAGYYYLYRSFLPFDTSSIPDNATITSASLNVYVYNKKNNDNDGDDFITLVKTSQASATALSTADFDQAGSINNPTEGINLSERKDITNIVIGKYLTFNLNSTGLGWISTTGATKLGLREGHDVIDSPFTTSSAASMQYNAVFIFSSEYSGTAQDPYLSITYTQTIAADSEPVATILQDLSYNYDAVGNITKIVDASDLDTAKTSNYAYDDLYRLKSATITGAKNNQNYTQTYNYNAIGNITNKSDVGDYIYAGTDYANPHAATKIGNKTFTYDNNGNLASDGATTYGWDYQNRMVSSGEAAISTTTSTVAITTTTINFYPTAGDGYIYSYSPSWDAAHDATSGSYATYTTDFIPIGPTKSTAGHYLYRSFLPFDTSSIPDDATITSASLNVFPQLTKNNDNDGDDFITLVNTSQASATTLSTADFDQAGSINNPTEGINLTERKDITNIAINKYLTFNLNSTGLGWISKTDATKLGLREGHDVIDSPFTTSSTASTQYNIVNIRSSEYSGTVQDPYLTVTYTQSTATATTTTVINEVVYQYDQGGQRTKKTANNTTTIYPFKHYEKEGNKISKYIYANGNLVATIETGNGVKYIHTDHLNSTSVITDDQGFATHVFDYYPYGQKRIDTGANNSNKQFIGQYFDEENNLSYLNARYYDGGRGQFLSEDPAHLDVGDQLFESKYKRSLQTHLLNPQSLNSYAYANNNPLKYSDPDGEILPVILLAAWAIAEVGMSAYDIYDTVTTLADSNASLTDKGIVTGGMLLGIVAPGGGYGTAGKQIVKHADDVGRLVSKAGDTLNGAKNVFSTVAEHAQKHYTKLSKSQIENLARQTKNNADIKIRIHGETPKTYYYNSKTNDLFISNPKSPTIFQPERGIKYLRDAVKKDITEGGWLK